MKNWFEEYRKSDYKTYFLVGMAIGVLLTKLLNMIDHYDQSPICYTHCGRYFPVSKLYTQNDGSLHSLVYYMDTYTGKIFLVDQ